jgi:hypothetical protein
MSVSKRWVNNPRNVQAVLALHRSAESPTIKQIAKKLGTTFHSILWICKNHVPEAEYKALKAIRYSRSKLGEKNPMTGKTGDQHHNWIGWAYDGHGYLTCLKDGKRQFAHRVVMAEALGLGQLPEVFDVHHIDNNKTNNQLDNLALVTIRGHRKIHYLQVKDSLSVMLKKSKLREALKYMTSQ